MKPKKIRKSRVTRLTVARLYNLGNYEHVRYEITAEIPRGGSAKQTLLDTVEILKGLKPPKKDYNFENAKAALIKDETQRSEYEKAHLDEFRATVSTYETLMQYRREALTKLDDVGGVSVKTDAKDKWEEDCPF